MKSPYKKTEKPDLLFKITQGVVCRFEVAVENFFPVQDELKPTVSVSSERHLSWEGRALSQKEIQDLRRGIELINIQRAPRVARKLTGESYHLEINGGNAFASYEWWGDLPAPWSSLRALIEALKALAIEIE